MDEKKEAETKVKFRGVSPFGQTTETDAVPLDEPVEEIISRARSNRVDVVVSMVLPVLQQVFERAPDAQLSREAATNLRLAVAAVAKEGLVRAKK